jgi:hypothetical protein
VGRGEQQQDVGDPDDYCRIIISVLLVLLLELHQLSV